MKSEFLRTALAVLGLASALVGGQAVAQDGLGGSHPEQANIPLKPADAAAQPWTLEHQGRSLCVVRLSDVRNSSGAFKVDISTGCGGSLPAGIAAWRPVTNGAAFVDADGRVLIDFERWSNSLLVADRSSGFDVQLRRGPQP
jgi:hypothetical protein